MTGKGHTLAGLICMIGAYKFSIDLTNSATCGVVSSIFMAFGATAPDWMEIRKKSGGTVIVHRTWTHWLPLWILLLMFGCSQISQNPILGMDTVTKPLFDYLNIGLNHIIASGIIGFSLGGLLHLLVDIPNPMGIPILTPYSRFSLKLWKSGKLEPLICFVLFLANLYYIDVIMFDLSKIQITNS